MPPQTARLGRVLHRGLFRGHLPLGTSGGGCTLAVSARGAASLPVPSAQPPDAAATSSTGAGQAGPRDVAAGIFGAAPPESQAPSKKGTSRDGGLSHINPLHAGRFYQRRLPTSQIPFSSEAGRVLFREALLAGTLENYFFQAEQFRTQDEPTFCGLSTLAMVLNCLRIDPMRTWKGAWRWFNEQNLGCCTGPEQVREEGLSFDMFRCLAGCNGADAVAHRAPPEEEDPVKRGAYTELFRSRVQAVSRSRDREVIVVCYSRESLGQSGAGHFSPVGGYHEASDSVLIMDVARFKYPPHWVPLEMIAEAMSKRDPDTGLPRGYLHLSMRRQEPDDWRTQMPLHVAYLPAAAGRRLSKLLSTSLATASSSDGSEALGTSAGSGSRALATMRRWLAAASTAEPQVLRQLVQVGDPTALALVIARLGSWPLFGELCSAYASALALRCDDGGGPADDGFPPLRFFDSAVAASHGGALALQSGDVPQESLGLETCGELWVLLLLLLPDHLRTSASAELGGAWVSKEIAKAVRGPWALPLEGVREALGHMLPPPQREARPCLDPAQQQQHASRAV